MTDGDKEGRKISKLYQFRLPLVVALEVDREIENGSFDGCNTVTTYFKRLVELRKAMRNELRCKALEAVSIIQSYRLTKRDLEQEGLKIEELTPR